MGVGYFTEGSGENARFGHTGWNEGYVTKFLMYKYRGLGAVIMLNSNEGKELMYEIERAIASVYRWPGYFAQEERKTAAVPPCLAGVYRTEYGTELSVRHTEDGLSLAVGALENIPLIPLNEKRYQVGGLNSVLVFHPQGDACGRLTLEQSARRIEAFRK